LDQFYAETKVSNDLLIFNYAAAKKFLIDRDALIHKLDSNGGIIET